MLKKEKISTGRIGGIQREYTVDDGLPETNHDVRYSGTLIYEPIEQQLRNLQGRILTVIDASFSDPEQRKAAKDLIKEKFSSHFSDVWNYLSDTFNRTMIIVRNEPIANPPSSGYGEKID